jgi:hypothetical protein
MHPLLFQVLFKLIGTYATAALESLAHFCSSLLGLVMSARGFLRRLSITAAIAIIFPHLRLLSIRFV